MRALACAAAALLASACSAQPPAKPADRPTTGAPALEAATATSSTDLKELSLVERARLLAPFVGGDLEDAQSTLGVAHTVERVVNPATRSSTSRARHVIYGDNPSDVILEAENGRIVSASVVQRDVDAFAVVYGLEDEMMVWLGPIEYENIDHGYYFWETDDWTFTAQTASDSVLELVVAER